MVTKFDSKRASQIIYDLFFFKRAEQFVFPDEAIRKAQLDSKMDIFSAGCVLIELFSDGEAPMDLSSLLRYRQGDDELLEKALSLCSGGEIKVCY